MVEQDTNRFQQMEENELNLVDLLRIVRVNWYWFLASTILCLGVAVLYLAWAPKVYTRTASVLIKDDSKGGGLSEASAFEEDMADKDARRQAREAQKAAHLDQIARKRKEKMEELNKRLAKKNEAND